MLTSPRTTVALTRFEDLLALGLWSVIAADPTLEIVADDVEQHRLEVVLAAHHPQVAVLDLDAIHVLADLLDLNRRYPDTKLVLLGTRPTTADCAQVLAFGACACMGRDIQRRDLLSAIHLASRGLSLVPRADHEPDARTSGPQRLTQREAEVLPMLQQARTNAQIAAELHVAVETVRTHAGNIYRKLGVSSRRELPPARASSRLSSLRATGSSVQSPERAHREGTRPSIRS